MQIRHGIIPQSRELETCDMATYRNKVAETYKNGTYRFGHLDNISLVGTVSDESGGYIPDVLDMLEENPFLRLVRILINFKINKVPPMENLAVGGQKAL